MAADGDAAERISVTETAPDETGNALPAIYFNGFQMSLSNADVNTVLLLNNQPQIGLNMSYTTAKTLAQALSEIVGALEKVTQRDIMTIKEVGAGLEALNAELESKKHGQPN